MRGASASKPVARSRRPVEGSETTGGEDLPTDSARDLLPMLAGCWPETMVIVRPWKRRDEGSRKASGANGRESELHLPEVRMATQALPECVAPLGAPRSLQRVAESRSIGPRICAAFRRSAIVLHEGAFDTHERILVSIVVVIVA